MEFIDVVKVYTEIGMLGLSAVLVIIMLWLYFKKGFSVMDKKDKQLDRNNKIQDDRYTELLNIILEQNKQNQEMLQKQLLELSSSVINGVTKHTLEDDENNSLSKIEADINDCLKRVLNKTSSSRVCLVRFHNGGRDMNGLSFLKMSMTNESVKLGLSPLMPEFQNMFRSFFSYLCEKLISEGHCYVDDINILKDVDTTMYEFLFSRDIQSIYSIPISNKNNTVIGFIYVECSNNTEVNKAQIEDCLHDKKIRIETLLNF